MATRDWQGRQARPCGTATARARRTRPMSRTAPIASTPTQRNPRASLVANLGEDGDASIVGARLWHIMRRFFLQAADILKSAHPALAEKLQRASPHWMHHSHASHALARGAGLTTVRDTHAPCVNRNDLNVPARRRYPTRPRNQSGVRKTVASSPADLSVQYFQFSEVAPCSFDRKIAGLYLRESTYLVKPKV